MSIEFPIDRPDFYQFVRHNYQLNCAYAMAGCMHGQVSDTTKGPHTLIYCALQHEAFKDMG